MHAQTEKWADGPRGRLCVTDQASVRTKVDRAADAEDGHVVAGRDRLHLDVVQERRLALARERALQARVELVAEKLVGAVAAVGAPEQPSQERCTPAPAASSAVAATACGYCGHAPVHTVHPTELWVDIGRQHVRLQARHEGAVLPQRLAQLLAPFLRGDEGGSEGGG